MDVTHLLCVKIGGDGMAKATRKVAKSNDKPPIDYFECANARVRTKCDAPSGTPEQREAWVGVSFARCVVFGLAMLKENKDFMAARHVCVHWLIASTRTSARVDAIFDNYLACVHCPCAGCMTAPRMVVDYRMSDQVTLLLQESHCCCSFQQNYWFWVQHIEEKQRWRVQKRTFIMS
jgi:hypothetical protein